MPRQPPTPPPIPRAQEAWLITGIPGAGKSTIARLLAQTLPRGAHIEGDRLAGMVVGGAVYPGQEPYAESARQSLLTIRHLCLLARSFARAGFVPVLDYVAMTRSGIARYRRSLQPLSFHLVVLNPGKDTALTRDRDRPEKTVAAAWTHLEDIMLRELPGLGLWVDTRAQTPQETVTHILHERARAILLAAHLPSERLLERYVLTSHVAAARRSSWGRKVDAGTRMVPDTTAGGAHRAR